MISMITYFFLLAFAVLQAEPPYRNEVARNWLEQVYLPSLSGKILYVGVGTYTQHYPTLTQTPELFATLDYDLSKAAYGSPFKHYTADLLKWETSEVFDHVSLFGIMGHPPTVTTSKYNIIDVETVRAAISRADKLVKVNGTLQLGPNHADFPGQDASFWIAQFSSPPLNKYKIITYEVYSDNIVWWGQKLGE